MHRLKVWVLSIDEFERRGGHLHFYSATPWRQDGQRVVRPEMRLIRRSLPQHMAEGYAPRHLVHQIRVLGKRGDASSAAEFHGEKVSARFESRLVEALVDQFFADDQPKTIIRVPPVSGGSGRLVERIAAAFHARGIRTVDATGVGGDKQATFLNALREERGRTYEESSSISLSEYSAYWRVRIGSTVQRSIAWECPVG